MPLGHPLGRSVRCCDVWRVTLAQTVKNLPTVQETWVWSLGQEDPLEKGMAIHSSILAWRIPWTEEPGSLWPRGSQRVRHDWVTNIDFFTFFLKSKMLYWQVVSHENKHRVYNIFVDRETFHNIVYQYLCLVNTGVVTVWSWLQFCMLQYLGLLKHMYLLW